MENIQQILETLPLPGSNGEQFTIYQSRHYPHQSPNRFVVRVLKKNFTGNDVADLLLQAKAYYEKKKGAEESRWESTTLDQLRPFQPFRCHLDWKTIERAQSLKPAEDGMITVILAGYREFTLRGTTQILVKK